MNYDVWGSWGTTVGPNSPLNDTCAGSPEGSAVSAIKAWTTAGFPADQIVLGVASYGHSFHVNPTDALDASGNIKPYPPFDKSQQPAGDKLDSTATGVDVCGNPNVVGGIFNFWGLIDGGFLTDTGTVADGIAYKLDNCSVTVRAFVLVDEMRSFSDINSFLAVRIQSYVRCDGVLRRCHLVWYAVHIAFRMYSLLIMSQQPRKAYL